MSLYKMVVRTTQVASLFPLPGMQFNNTPSKAVVDHFPHTPHVSHQPHSFLLTPPPATPTFPRGMSLVPSGTTILAT